MTIFDDFGKFRVTPRGHHRLNMRHEFCVSRMKPWFEGRRVLDLASHDGRWAYAYAAAGASEVVGVEGRLELVEEFAAFPDNPVKSRIRLFHDDVVTFMTWLVSIDERFDFIANLGFYYHTMEHYRVLSLARDLGAASMVVDSEFIMTDNPVIQIAHETTDKVSNAIATYDGQVDNVIGVPSTGAMEQMADVLGYDTHWLDWDSLPEDRREGLGDYFRNHRKRRGTCRLERRAAPPS